MVRHITPTTSLENLQREAKRWLKALRARPDQCSAISLEN
jgi:hypothetical protein